jgi:glycosyltransferase involved in cell wall biosynthesis
VTGTEELAPNSERQNSAGDWMTDRLLVASPMEVAGNYNSRTQHLARHLAPHFRKTVVISRADNTHRSSWQQWCALLRMRTTVRQEGTIRWISLNPWGSVRGGLGLHLLGLANPYAVPRWGLRRVLRRFLSTLGVVLELGILPSLLLTYLARIRGCVDVFVGEGHWEILLGLILRALGRARVVVYDDFDYQPGFQPISELRRRMTAALERFGIRRADLVISVGERLACLRRAQGAREVRVIPNGVDVRRFGTARSQRQAGGPRRPTAIYIGYIGAWAGVDLVLDAASLVVRQIPNLRVIILGHGTPLEVEALRTGIDRRGIASIVEYRGKVPYEALPAHLAEADLGLAMFRPLDLTRYAFPLKVVEYMATGLPVVTTTDTEAADLVISSGVGAAVPFEADAVAEAVVDLLRDSDRRLGQGSAAFGAAQAFDWELLMSRHMAAIREVTQPGPGRRKIAPIPTGAEP